MFSRRGFNIDSLAVGVTQDENYSRMTVIVCGDDLTIEQVTKQLEKLVEVEAVQNLSKVPSVARGMALLKVRAVDNRTELLQLAEVFRANIVDVRETTLTFEITGDEGKINALAELLLPYGLLEMIRTGLIGLTRGEQTVYQLEERYKDE
jgi:acetolactate synthase-1/3 small subunit